MIHFQKKVRVRKPRPKATLTRTFLCSECGDKFTIEANLKRHMKMHRGEYDYQCEFCDQKFYTVSSRAGHETRHHPDEIKGTRTQCDQCVEKVKDLEAHKNECHFDGEGDYPCNYCGFKTKNQIFLHRHLKAWHRDKNIESEVKIQCDQCPALVMKRHLNFHQRRHHDPNLPLECRFCAWRSLKEQGIRDHESRYHYEMKFEKKKIPCGNNCGKEFSEVPYMRWHMKRFCDKSSVKKEYIEREKNNPNFEKRKVSRNNKRRQTVNQYKQFAEDSEAPPNE